MAEAPPLPKNGISLNLPVIGPIAATGTAAIIGLLIVVLLGYLYFEMDKIEDHFVTLREHQDQQFKDIQDVQRYNACLSRLTLWRAGQPRGEQINLEILPDEFYYCLPAFELKRKQ